MVAPLPGADPGTGSTPESGVDCAGLHTPLDPDVLAEIAWIDEQLRRPIVIPSPNAIARRERLRRERARLEAMLGDE